MNGIPEISVVLPTYNRPAFLRAAVESVFAQTFTDWELVIADDGSGPDTVGYLNSMSEVPRVKVIHLSHSGNPSRVRNIACRAATGRYIAFLDSDDVWLPQKLARQLEAMKGSPPCRWSYTAVTRIDEQGNIMSGEQAHRRPIVDGDMFLEKLLTLEVAVATPSVMVHKALLDAAGGFDETLLFFEDYDLWHRLIALGPVCAIGEALTLVRSHQEHYTCDRVGVYEHRLRLLDKLSAAPSTAHPRWALKREIAKTSLALARVLSSQGQVCAVCSLLWQSRTGSWSQLHWWRAVAQILARALTPARARWMLRACQARLWSVER